jgi:hypothetical protein
MTVQQEFCYDTVGSVNEEDNEALVYLFGRLVEHLALCRKRS